MHRLDANTTGLMVVAKSERAYSALKRAFREREVDKRYHALVQGHPDPLRGTVDAPIGRHPSGDGRFAVLAGGRPSVTHYDTLEAFRGASLAGIGLETGRTHQIRVHMAAIRHPCAGDLLYGADPVLAARLGLTRQWLHAVSLAFAHPADGRRVEFGSGYPPDLAHALAVLRARAVAPECRRGPRRTLDPDRLGRAGPVPPLPGNWQAGLPRTAALATSPGSVDERLHGRSYACLKEAVSTWRLPRRRSPGLVRPPARAHRVLDAGRRGPAEGPVRPVRAGRHAGHRHDRPRQPLRRLRLLGEGHRRRHQAGDRDRGLRRPRAPQAPPAGALGQPLPGRRRHLGRRARIPT